MLMAGPTLVLAAALAVAGTAEAGQQRPNVVVVMTDDQRLWDMEAMPQTKRLIGRAGTTFENAVATYPLCCPSRSTFLSGQYEHNHGVLGNHAPEGGYAKFDFTNALGVWLQAAGYRTAHVGKQLNEYGSALQPDQAAVPPGNSNSTDITSDTIPAIAHGRAFLPARRAMTSAMAAAMTLARWKPTPSLSKSCGPRMPRGIADSRPKIGGSSAMAGSGLSIAVSVSSASRARREDIASAFTSSASEKPTE